jgi:HAD superfamily hydrolase (TIGR01458 family)
VEFVAQLALEAYMSESHMPCYSDANRASTLVDALPEISLFIFDIDEVLCSAGCGILGAPEAISALRQKGKQVRFLTNDAWSSRSSRVKELSELGFSLRPEELYTSSFLAAEYIRSLGCPPTLLLLNGEGVNEFRGIQLVSENAEVVAVGDFFDSYSRPVLEHAYSAIIGGAEFIAMQKDRYWMDQGKPMINLGFWVAGLEYCTGKTAIVVGKPSSGSYERVLRDAGLPPRKTVMISDDLFSDLAGAARVGIHTVHVRRAPPPVTDPSTPLPDLTVASINEILQLLS